MDNLLLVFSLAFFVVMLGMIVVPYWKQRRDLLNAWTLFLFGSATFVGLSGYKAATSPKGYVDYNTSDYLWYFAGVIVFYVTLWLTYHKFRWPQRLAWRRFNHWPSTQPETLFLMLPVCFVLSLGLLFPPNIQGVAQFMIIVGKNGVVFATIFVLVIWMRQPHNPILLYIALAVLLFSVGFAMLSGGSSRRDLVGVLVTLPLVFYWVRYRYARPIRTLIIIGLIGVVGTLMVNGYSSFRHHLQKSGNKNVGTLVRAVLDLPSRMLTFNEHTSDQMLGQNAVDVSLLAINVYQTEQWPGFDTQPLHSLKFIAVNPIPRAFWPDKPEGLGRTLPRDTKLRGGRETWGPGIVGHGFHEGGLHMLVFYAFIVGTLLRLFDELLARFPGNPYLLGILATNAGQIVGWPRGDIGTFTVQIIGGVIAGLFIMLIGRIVFGQEQYPSVGYTPVT